MTLHDMAGVGDMLIHAIERHGQRIAFEIDGVQTSYARLGRDVAHTIAVLHDIGVKEGDRVAQIAANSYEMFVVIAAAYVGGFVSVALQYNGDQDEHRYALDDCTPAVLIVDEERKPRAQTLAAACSHPFRTLTHSGIAGHTFAGGSKPAPIAAFLGRTGGRSCARVNYTGGTTGRPKGVMISSSALAFQALLHVAANALDVDARVLISSPISHGAGSLIPPVLSRGGCIVLHRTFAPAEVVAAVTAGTANILFLVPSMLYALLDHPNVPQIPKGRLKRIIYGASPASPARLKQALQAFGPVLAQSYGLSEAPGTILHLTPEDHVSGDDGRLSAAGRPYPGVQVKLFANGAEVSGRTGEVGEIWVRAPHVMLGYWNAPELTAEALSSGWLKTGDLARVDSEGFFYIVDRVKDMVISGGFNIYASELEQVLDAHPGVKASAIIGVPDTRWGEAVKAFVVPNGIVAVTAEELRAYVRERKGPIKTPKSIEFIGELPLTRVGKVDKKQLRAAYWRDADRSVN